MQFGTAITPRSFTHGEHAPPRAGGDEIEHDVQGGSGHTILDRSNPKRGTVRGWTGDDATELWLPNGGKLYIDGIEARVPKEERPIEYAGPEAASARKIGAANLASILILQKITPDGVRIYRHGGTIIGDTSKTLGVQRSLTTPRTERSAELAQVWDTLQAVSVVFAGAGIVGPDGLEFSQKARGIAQPTALPHEHPETIGEEKSMGWIRSNEDGPKRDDVFHGEEKGWFRIEARALDPLFSRWATWLSAATGSLALRFIERRAVLNHEQFNRIRLCNPVEALHRISRDTTFKKAYETSSGKRLTVLNLLECYAEAGDRMRQNINLPEDEHKAVDALVDIGRRLGQANIPEGDVTAVENRLDWAARLNFLRKYGKGRRITSHDSRIVGLSLLWDRIHPVGAGLRHWEAMYREERAPDPIGQELIDHAASKPFPGTRSFVRGNTVRHYTEFIRGIGWGFMDVLESRVNLHTYDDQSAWSKIRSIPFL